MVTCDTGSCSGTGSVSYQVIISGSQSVGEEITLPSANEPDPPVALSSSVPAAL